MNGKRSPWTLSSAGVLAAAVAALPIGWVLGIEQLVPGGLLIAGVAWLTWRRRLRWPVVTVPLVLLWLLSWISAGVARLVPFEWVAFAQGQFSLLAGMAALGLAANLARERDLRVAVGAIAGLAVLAAAVGLLAKARWIPLQFSPLLEPVVRPVLPATPLVEERLLTRVVAADWGRYIRPSVFFLYANFLAAGMIACGFVCLTAAQLTGGGRRILFGCGTVAALVATLGTSGRASAAAFVGGLVAWASGTVLARRLALRGVVYTLVAGSLVVAVLLVWPLRGGTLMERALVDMRWGSISTRAIVYDLTIRKVLERPWLGHGVRQTSQSEAPGASPLRLGSHSTLLNVAYRSGLPGLALYLTAGLLLATRWLRHAVPVLAGRVSRPPRGAWLGVGMGGLAVAFDALFIDLQLDVNAYWLSWLLAGLVYAPAVAGATGPTGGFSVRSEVADTA